MKEIKGDLITLAKEGNFDLIGHGCNCFCRMGRGIAPQIKEAFPEAWRADEQTIKGDIKKLGNFTYGLHYLNNKSLIVLNIYSQYGYDSSSKPIDYEALTLALRKINKIYKNRKIGLPLIGAGLAGGDWNRIKNIIETELQDMGVIIVHYEK
jgi:O-acetyl-ADP-ribose deacetylase (regulator of RNase III)